MSLVVDEHRQYLDDPVRLDAFDAAVRHVVKPGDVVVDLGAGTGILGLMACRAGAGRVYAIDDGGMIELARAAARHNGFADRIVHIRQYSGEVTLPEPADVILGDQIGHFGFEAGVLEFFDDARRRMLRPGGTLIPGRLELFVTAVESPALHRCVEFWREPRAGFSFGPLREWAVNTGYPVDLSLAHLLSPAVRGAVIDLSQPLQPLFTVEGSVAASADGTVHGIGGWFSAELAPGVRMTNDPSSPDRILRRNVWFPLGEPLAVRAGDPIHFLLRIRPRDMVVTWEARAGSRVRRHSTIGGMLIAREDLRALRPDARPSLTRGGLVRRSVLELCDGNRTIADIERELYARHPSLFESQDHASAFAAEVLGRYSTPPS